MATFKFAIIGTDHSGGMPGPDDGKAGMAITVPGAFAKGYKIVKGGWNPHGIGVVHFDTEDAADKWRLTQDGIDWLARYDNVILARVKA